MPQGQRSPHWSTRCDHGNHGNHGVPCVTPATTEPFDALESEEVGEWTIFVYDGIHTQERQCLTPENATYTSHQIQNKIIVLMSEIMTSQIVNELGDSWYTLRVDGTKIPTGCENMSILLHYLDMDNEIPKRLLVMDETECKRLFFSTLDSVTGELSAQFGERNSELVEAMSSLFGYPEGETTAGAHQHRSSGS